MTQSNSHSVIRPVVVTVTLAATAFALVATFAIYWPRITPSGLVGLNTPPGQIIEKYGTFRSPRGNGVVTFSSVKPAESSVTVSANTPAKSPSAAMSFDPAQTWFGAWDEEERFWVYTGSYGVHLEDMVNGLSSSTYAGKYAGDVKGWKGIPTEFLRRLPDTEIRKE